MVEFKSRKDYWAFAEFVMRKTRHFLDTDSQRFVDAVIQTSVTREGTVEKGAVLWRAQLGHDWREHEVAPGQGEVAESFMVEDPFQPERMVPLRDRANEGRVNPKGIPCLYFSTDIETAMTETRPWIGSFVSVAQFVMLRNLKVVDCSAESGPLVTVWLGTGEPDPNKRERMVWKDINTAFSLPVTVLVQPEME